MQISIRQLADKMTMQNVKIFLILLVLVIDYYNLGIFSDFGFGPPMRRIETFTLFVLVIDY
jgi:hypothetical protein